MAESFRTRPACRGSPRGGAAGMIQPVAPPRRAAWRGTNIPPLHTCNKWRSGAALAFGCCRLSFLFGLGGAQAGGLAT